LAKLEVISLRLISAKKNSKLDRTLTTPNIVEALIILHEKYIGIDEFRIRNQHPWR